MAEFEESDYVGTLLRDPNSSRLLEIIATRCPNDAFDALWKTYFKGKLPRLAAHPSANFVVAKAIERLSEEQLSEACDDLKNTWTRVIRKCYAYPTYDLPNIVCHRYSKDWRSESCDRKSYHPQNIVPVYF